MFAILARTESRKKLKLELTRIQASDVVNTNGPKGPLLHLLAASVLHAGGI
jgi:hypothetical protein